MLFLQILDILQGGKQLWEEKILLYKNYITYDSSHLRECRFRVSGTKKEVRDWKITGEGADYFRITDYGLLQMDWEPAYVEPCVTATVTAILEDGRKLTAAGRR